MKRRSFIRRAATAPFALRLPGAQPTKAAVQSGGVRQDPNTAYFPDRIRKFVWRNWDLVPVDRIAAVLEVDPQKIAGIGSRMGLAPVARELLIRYEMRNRFAVIKRNWDYVPNDQLGALLRMTAEEIDRFLHQDIAFLHNVGPKPDCPPLRFDELTANTAADRRMAAALASVPGGDPSLPREDAFAFIEDLSRVHSGPRRSGRARAESHELDLSAGWSVRLPEGAGTALRSAARDFAGFMSEQMRGRVEVVNASAAEPPVKNAIELSVAPDPGSLPDTHEIAADGNRVVLRAADERGLMRGLLSLEELMERRRGPFLPRDLKLSREAALSPRIVFPYFARFGDVLEDPDFESYYPQGFLHRIFHMGMSAIWLPAVLRDLVPSSVFPEFGRDSSTQLRRLNWLVARSAEAGLGVYLYLNEPRGMPESFFNRYPAIKGELGRPEAGLFAMCTSTEMVQRYLVESLERLFTAVPRLGGVILITASENLTSCYSLKRKVSCPRCRGRKPHEVVAEVITLIARGAKNAAPAAEVIAWDWSWPIVEDDPQTELIRALPAGVSLMADFERGTKITRGGVESVVNEYCLSVPGPSPRAEAHLRLAAEQRLKPMAKIQLGTTWECGSMPFIPVLSLLGRKFEQMARSGVRGAMQTWTLGGCPSVNTELAGQFYWGSGTGVDAAMTEVASRRYGDAAAPGVVRAWEIFSDAFQHYPFSNSVVYSSQVPYGPAHPLYFFDTHRPPTLQNTRDTLSWTAPFGPDIVAAQFEKMASRWQQGVALFREALEHVDRDILTGSAKDLGVARALELHFRSIANQIRFLQQRNRLQGSADPAEKRSALEQLSGIAKRELDLAAELYGIARTDSRIGFEAFFQYMYRPHDILEKILSCRHIIDVLIPEAARAIQG